MKSSPPQLRRRVAGALLAAAALSVVSCSDSGGPPPLRTGTPAYYFQTAKDAYAKGFTEVDLDDHAILLVEYAVDGFGTPQDLDKRHRLQDRLNETLGWTGLGYCDGGSIGSDTMEAACYVVDFEVAKAAVEKDLRGTEFEDFTRIYDERDPKS